MASDKGKGTPHGLNLDDTDSEAMKFFDEKFLLVRDGIHALNPRNGCIAGTNLKDAPLNYLNTHSKDSTENEKRLRLLYGFYKSAVVNLMVVFEGYVHDLFTEAFTFTLWDDSIYPRRDCEESWPAVRDLVTKLVTNNTKQEKKTEKKTEFFDIARDQDVWLYLLGKHMDDTLSKLTPRITSMQTVLTNLFILGNKTINLLPTRDRNLKPGEGEASKIKPVNSTTMQRRQNDKNTKNIPHLDPTDSANQAAGIKPDAQITHAVIHMAEFPMEIMLQNDSFRTKWRIPDQHQREVIIHKIETLTHILDLFYAIRCISVHGKPKPTVDGVLANFPKADAQGRTLNLGDDVVEKYLFDIHDKLCRGELPVDYFLCINVSRFILTTAIGLQRALGYFIYYQLKYSRFNKVKHKFWGLVRDQEGIMVVPQLKLDKKQKISTAGAAGIPETSVAGDDDEE